MIRSFSRKERNPIKKFNRILSELAENHSNKDIYCAIQSWCEELSIDKKIDGATIGTISRYSIDWLKQDRVISGTLKIYQDLLVNTDKKLNHGVGNSVVGILPTFHKLEEITEKNYKAIVKETKKGMSIKPILLVAFVLTGVGVLLLLLDKKTSSNKNRSREDSHNRYSSSAPTYVPEKQILTLLINADRNRELINSLKNSSYLKAEDSCKLYDATQGLWMRSETEFNSSDIKEQWSTNINTVDNESEYSESDVYFVKIELNRRVDVEGFEPNAIQTDCIDSFNSLANQRLTVKVSSRLSCKSYEQTEFYSR